MSGTVTSRSARAPGGERQRLVLDRRRPDQVEAVDREHPVGRVGPELDQRVVGVDHPQPHGVAGLRHDGHLALEPVERADPEGVRDRDRLDVLLDASARLHHERAEQALDDLLVGDLVGVVPVGAGVLDDEAVDELLARHHRVLGDPGDPVLPVRYVDPVPVQRRAVGHRLVAEADLDEVALRGLHHRAGARAVDGEAVDLAARGQGDRAGGGDQVDADVGRRRSGRRGGRRRRGRRPSSRRPRWMRPVAGPVRPRRGAGRRRSRRTPCP